MIWLVIIVLGCSDPVPLPESVLPPPSPEARMVRSGAVQGYLVHPVRTGTESGRGILMLVETIDDANRGAARASTAKGATVFVTESREIAIATAYLNGLAGMKTVAVDCRRPDCR